MDEALKKINQTLEAERPASRLKGLMPQASEAAKAPESSMGITHYTKAPVEQAPAVALEPPQRSEIKPEPDPAAKIGVGARVFTLDELGASSPPSEPVTQNQPGDQIETPRRFEPPAEIDPAAKIGVGAREFTLDELGTDSQTSKDPMMGQMLKPSTFREMTLDDLASQAEE